MYFFLFPAASWYSTTISSGVARSPLGHLDKIKQNFTMCGFTDRDLTLRNKSETVKQPKQGHYGSVIWCWQEQYPSGRDEATLLSVCNWIRVGLALLPTLKKPQVLPVALPERTLTVYLSSYCPKKLWSGYGDGGNPIVENLLGKKRQNTPANS